jgi:hypothetical protein
MAANNDQAGFTPYIRTIDSMCPSVFDAEQKNLCQFQY